MKSLLRLFKAVEIGEIQNEELGRSNSDINKESLQNGFIFSPEVIGTYPHYELKELCKLVIDEIGITPSQMNNAFHKSWDKVRNESIFVLVMEQLIHYYTTYGYEQLGMFKDDRVYVPAENLDVPEIKDGIKLTVIKGMTKYDMRVALMDLLDTGIALKEQTVNDCIELGTYIGLSVDEVNSINNKEVKVALYDELGMVPKEPVEFLRYVVYKSTGKTLLIKNSAMVNEIKEGDLLTADDLFRKYNDSYGLKGLAQIFNRFKPLFLAFKAIDDLRPVINKIGKLSKVYHKPMRADYLNDITFMIKHGYPIDHTVLREKLSKVNNFRKIRLAYALNYRIGDVSSILYKVRNGKGFATNFDFTKKKQAKRILNVVLGSIAEGLSKNVEGKKVYIPEGIRYALPATEKQFTGNFPSGTSVTVDENMLFGIHWTDVDRYRIDLDLSLIDVAGNKYGWDGGWRDESRNILFSGDLTSAPKPKGASELFYVKKDFRGSNLLMVNYFNYQSDIDVPFKILVAQDKIKSNCFGKRYMVDPNNVLATSDSVMDVKQKILGLLNVDDNGCRFYFTEVDMGGGRTSMASEYVMKSNQYMFDFYKNNIDMDEMLLAAGAELVDEFEECDIDLSPENIKKDDIINLLV